MRQVLIGGSLIGGSATFGGQLSASGSIGHVTIRGDLVGGTGGNSGQIITDGKIAAVTIGGSIRGGSGGFSGSIFAGSLGRVKVKGKKPDLVVMDDFLYGEPHAIDD